MEKKSLPREISGERVVLRQHSIGQASEMFNYVDKDRARLSVFLPWVDYTRSVQDEENYIRMTLEKWESLELFDYGLFKRDGTYLGNLGLHTISWEHERGEIGYWILGKFEGQGFVSEGVRNLEKILFDSGFNRVEIRCSSANERSASIPRALGYRLEGTLRQDCVEKGRFRDTWIFAKLKSDRSTAKDPK